jgi:hypothetical protein
MWHHRLDRERLTRSTTGIIGVAMTDNETVLVNTVLVNTVLLNTATGS